MDELSNFCADIRNIIGDTKELTIEKARSVIKTLNDFLYTNYQGIGIAEALDTGFDYLSDFHKYWEQHYREILNTSIDEINCEKVADALHSIYLKTNGKAFSDIWDTCGLSSEQVCRIRLLTANQDFRGSRDFSAYAKIFKTDNTIFDEEKIYNDPEDYIKHIGATKLAQNDKRVRFAKQISEFVLKTKRTPVDIIKHFDSDLWEFRNALINYPGAGYGSKKADMFIRDMVVLEIWKNVKHFELIDVASDINTVKVALRTGILKTSIPLVSSFLDIFCYQYSYIDEMNALAWRNVWNIWKKKYPTECIISPCLIDYFVYKVVGKQFCKENLAIFRCDTGAHFFKWHSAQNKTCQECFKNGKKGVKASCVEKVRPCNDPEGEIAILNSEFVLSLPEDEKFNECPFKSICDTSDTKNLQPPKSISIVGKTSWTSAYSEKGNGGGGLMA